MVRIDLAEYELCERLGAGTVGTIFLARKRGTDEVYAVKFLSPVVSSNELIVSRFTREMMILEKLNHPNILAYYGSGRHDSQLFFLMEFVRGGTLKDLLIKSGRLSWREVAETGRQVSAALQHAHNHGIIHRDLKPGNVFVTESGDLKLGDFGIARDTHAQDITDTGLTVGTYSYMAPELIRGEREITGKVDLYALGCLLFELLVGSPPYQGDNFAQIFDQHLKSEPPSAKTYVADCPGELDDLIKRLLAKLPEQRPFNARAVQGALGNLLDPEGGGLASTTHDRGAGEINASEIHTAKKLLSARVAQAFAGTRPDVSWAKLGWCLIAIAAVIVATAILNR